MGYKEQGGCLSAVGKLMQAFWSVIVVLGGYVLALSWLGSTHEWWHYLAAIPLSIIACGLFGAEWAQNIEFFLITLFWGLIKLLGIPVLSIALTIDLLSHNAALTTAGVGALFFAAGVVFAFIRGEKAVSRLGIQ